MSTTLAILPRPSTRERRVEHMNALARSLPGLPDYGRTGVIARAGGAAVSTPGRRR